MRNHFGKTSKLFLKAGLKNNQTVLKDASFTAPFKIMHPFYAYAPHSIPELNDCMTIMCLTASAGVMSGDEQHYEMIVEEGAKLEFVSQAYEKIHKMESGYAQRTANLHVERNALLYYNPQPTIPFKDSAFTSSLNIHLQDYSSQLIFKEILSAGRCARGEQFEFRYYDNFIHIYQEDKLIYADHTRLHPQEMALNEIGLFEHYTHLGTLILFNISKDTKWLNAVREYLENNTYVTGGITQNDHGYIIRLLGHEAQQIEGIMDKLLEL